MKLNLLKATMILVFVFLFNSIKAQSDFYNWTFKFGGGSARIATSGALYDWYGNGKGPQIFVAAGYKNILLNATASYFNEATKTDLDYNGLIVPEKTDARMVYLNISVSYEQEIGMRFFLEPYVGYVMDRITTNAIGFMGDEVEIIRDINGMAVGLNIIKYIKFYDTLFIGLYFNTYYNFLPYNEINEEMPKGSLGYSFGIILKATDRQ